MVKLLIAKGAAQQYLEDKPENRHVLLGTNKEMKPNPLHWACFKGHLEVFYTLIKAGLHWEDVDSCGNNSVMLAAAGGALPIFKSFLQIGVPIDCHNTRGHTVKDLTTNENILHLSQNYTKAK
jgi:ankyrin repeat protein